MSNFSSWIQLVTTLVDNVYDALLASDERITRVSFGVGLAEAPQFEGGRTAVGLRAEHGFSALVTVRRGVTTTSLLFDTGLSPDAMMVNADRLGIDLLDVQSLTEKPETRAQRGIDHCAFERVGESTVSDQGEDHVGPDTADTTSDLHEIERRLLRAQHHDAADHLRLPWQAEERPGLASRLVRMREPMQIDARSDDAIRRRGPDTPAHSVL